MVDTVVQESPFDMTASTLQALDSLSNGIEQKIHLLASTGDEELAKLALAATKQIFDMGRLDCSRSQRNSSCDQLFPSSHTRILISTHSS